MGNNMIEVINIKSDFQMIVHKFPRETEGVHIYPLGDLHIGSRELDMELFRKWRRTVLADPVGYVVLIGDMIDNGLRNSKTNVYEATMSPWEQKETLAEELRPLKDRILGAIRGNHEERSVRESDDCPMYDVMARLGLEDLYREGAGFVKINLGEKNKERQWSYTLVLAHGASKSKVDKFNYSIDGMDVMISGHTHQPSSNFPAKIVVDNHNEQVRLVGFVNVVVPSFARMGGYALKGMYMPQDSGKFPVLMLSGTEKEVNVLWM